MSWKRMQQLQIWMVFQKYSIHDIVGSADVLSEKPLLVPTNGIVNVQGGHGGLAKDVQE